MTGILQETETLPKTTDRPDSATKDKNSIRVRTARNWLARMGLKHRRIGKGVYVDGHEREDVVKYRQKEFIPRWLEYRSKFLAFDPETSTWSRPQSTHSEEGRPLVLVTHDESTFNSNDGFRSNWMRDGEQPLRPKGVGKGIMVSAFCTAGGFLRVPDHVTDAELAAKNNWPRYGNGSLVREAIHYLEYGKDNYWDGDKMIDHVLRVAVPIFEVAFPGCQALFAFDNASNHCSFATDALVANKMNLGPAGRQPRMRDGWNSKNDTVQQMSFSEDHPNPVLRGQAKGLKQVLLERGLWNDRRSDGSPFLRVCLRADGRRGCPSEGPMAASCCATVLMANQPDFLAQKGRLEEEVETAGHLAIFYPKFHCELNFIEHVWCAAKFYARENCQYSIAALRQTVPEALRSVQSKTVHRYYQRSERIIDAYANGSEYGTAAFKERIYNTHRQVTDRTKW